MARARTFTLTHDLLSAHSGGAAVCLDARAMGRSYRLHPSRPEAGWNERITRAALRSEVIDSDGQALDVEPAPEAAEPTILRVDICGVIEQRAGYHEPCGGWSDGHDAIAERLIAALAEGDVVMVIDSPGGAAAGLQEAVRRVVEAKEAHGRRVYAYADEMICSAAYWWAACVADEIFAPEFGAVGSIGVVSSHASVAGMLDKDGVAVTYFVAPGAGKIAFAPELPLSELGKERGERDTWEAFEAFANAVGPARGLSRDDIVELNADVLSGDRALNARLIDGIASLEEVLEYALVSAGDNDMRRASKKSEDEKPEDKPEEAEEETPEEAEGDEPEEDADAEDGDGESDDDSEPADDADDESDDESDDEEPEPKKAKKAKPSARKTSSLASLAGLREGASTLAIKSAMIPLVGLADFAMTLTEAGSPAEARGALKALAEDAKQLAVALAGARTELASLKRKARGRERMDLLRKLSAAELPGYTRGELFIDEVDEESGKRKTKPAKQYAEMKLETLKGLVNTKLANRSATPIPKRTPFEPDTKPLEQLGKGVTALDREIAEKNGFDPEKVAASRNALFNKQPRGV